MHAAAEIWDKLVHQTSVSDLETVFRPKVSGAGSPIERFQARISTYSLLRTSWPGKIKGRGVIDVKALVNRF
ncbi:hypothetical protein JQ570_20630 [Bradyrhizobium liaoningense]|nr:hypothetical protein [Bradyrhizobium liaoningense]